MLLTMTTENLVNCHCQLSITIGHGVKVVKVNLVKVGFALQLLQLQLEKDGVNMPEKVCQLPAQFEAGLSLEPTQQIRIKNKSRRNSSYNSCFYGYSLKCRN